MNVDLSHFSELYPWQGHYLARGSSRLHYLDEGAGEPLLLLHGNPTWSFFWRHLVTALDPEYRVIVPDHIGMGLSDKPSDDDYTYTLSNRVDDIEALVQHLGVESLTLIAHDWGGMIGLALAERHPTLIRRLILMNTAGFLLPEGRSLPWRLRLARGSTSELLVRGMNAFLFGAVRLCSTRPGRMTPQVRRGYLAPYDCWDHRIGIHRFVRDIPLAATDPAYDIVQRVERSLDRYQDLPVQIFWGEKDFVFDRHFLAEWQRRLPGAAFHTFADCGHFILEDAHETITPLIRDFLARTREPS